MENLLNQAVWLQNAADCYWASNCSWNGLPCAFSWLHATFWISWSSLQFAATTLSTPSDQISLTPCSACSSNPFLKCCRPLLPKIFACCLIAFSAVIVRFLSQTSTLRCSFLTSRIWTRLRKTRAWWPSPRIFTRKGRNWIRNLESRSSPWSFPRCGRVRGALRIWIWFSISVCGCWFLHFFLDYKHLE